MEAVRLKTPLNDNDIEKLRAGTPVLLSGTLFTARDEAHKRLTQLISQGESLPVDLTGQVIYYVGPTPAPPGKVIGSAGPTTSGRMDKYTPELLKLGLKATVGKGSRSEEVKEAMVLHKAVYLAAVGGAGALLAKKIKNARVVAYPELGPEALYELEVEELPLVVVNDIYRGDLYREGRKEYQINTSL